MALRCTSTDVLAIMSVTDVDMDNVTDLSAFISIASPYVDDIEAAGLVNVDKLKAIEIYLAAHFAALRYKHSMETKIGDHNAQDRFDFKLGVGFDATYYGQQAQKMDTTKTLSRMNLTTYRFDSFIPEAAK